MIKTMEQAVIANSERSYDNRRNIRQKDLQRRNQVTDLYGIPFTRQGDAGNDAVFYISISPDLVYYERFQFKLAIQSFTANVKGATVGTAATIENTSLSVSGGSISPNPHGHTSPAHTHTLVNGITQTQVTADQFTMSVDGIDITPYLAEQHGGDWVDGEGLWPTPDLDDDIEDFYDLLDVASLMEAEQSGYRESLLKPGFKEVRIGSNGPFSVTLYLYTKYNHVCR